MPKFQKKKRDKILDLISEGYTNKEIAETLDVSPSTVSKMRKLRTQGAQKNDGPLAHFSEAQLSEKVLKKLLNLKSILGTITIDDTIDLIFEDYIFIMKEKFEFDLEFAKTPGDIFKYFKDCTKLLKRLTDVKNHYEHARVFLDTFGINDDIYFYYSLMKEDGYEGSLIDFIGDYIVEYFHNIKGYSIPTILNKNPFLNPDDPALKELQRELRIKK